MRKKWNRKQCGSTYGAITLHRAIENCQSFYQEPVQDDYQITIKNPSPAPAPTVRLPMHTLDDTGNAERMNDYCGRVFRYNYTDKRWMYYKDGVWVYDDRGAIFTAADKILERMKMEQKSWAEHETGAYLQDYQKHMKKTRSNASKTAMVKEFQHLVPISPAELDTHKTLVNTQNGVVNLDTCTTVPHSPEMLMTRMLGTSMPATPKKPVLWLMSLS